MSTKSNKSRRALSEINITPFVDVVLVLLVIFMVTAPLNQQSLDLKLPKTKKVGPDISKKAFIIRIKKNSKIYISDTSVPLFKVGKKIKAIFKYKKDKSIFVQADYRVLYGVVAKLMAELKAAGFYKVGLVTQSQ
ncbi:MAG: biopolymer transporter ExbD [Bdellovibrionales bacterium]|nr:biopolymer transporter ExbD [Bdellovibrionales bacterium]